MKFEIQQSPVICCIIALALISYFLIIKNILLARDKTIQHDPSSIETLSTLIATLPLLGLLGTISGLLKTFSVLSQGSLDQSSLLSTGIAEALLTTQYGLLTAIPGWLLLGFLTRSQHQEGEK